MKNIINLLCIIPVFVFGQGIGTRVNGTNGALEQFVQNSPGNSISNSRMVTSLKDSSWYFMHVDSFIVWPVRNTLNHGTPGNILWSLSDGTMRTSPVASIPIVNSQIASVAWSKITSTPTTISGYGITDVVSTARGALSQGTGISYNNSTGVITNSSPDQTVSLTGAGINVVTGTYPSFTITGTAPGNTNVSAYGTGTAYTLTTSSAKITFGTTSPAITIPAAGTYLIISNVTLDYTGLTTLAVAACNFKVRRTNNTAADIANTTQTFNVPIVTLLTQTGGDIDIPAFIYTTANNNDVLELWGSRGAITVGSINVTNGYMVAIRIF